MQVERGLVACPHCGSAKVAKTLMAPNVTTGEQKDATQTLVMDAARKDMLDKLKDAVKQIKAGSEDVGDRFPDEARKIHYGESETRAILGKATPDEAQSLIEEGIEIAPLPVLPDDVN